RWSSAFSDPQWIEIDLQATYNISQVVLIWETASAKAYSIDVSNDNVNWTTVQNVTSGTGGTETWNLTGVSGRYIRMHGTLRNTIWGYSLYEFEVFGSSSVTNLPPVANPGTSQTITLPTNSVILDGSASTDPDGTITAYAWSQVSGPSTATMINGNTSKATAGNLVAGTYTFGLTVTDNGGLTSSGTVNVTVATDLPPIANAGTNQTITLPANSVILDGSASTDPDGTITAYAWSQVNGPNTGTITNGNAVKATVSNLVAGTYTFSLTVTDNTGLTASNTVTITVNNIVVANLALNKPATSSSVESSSFPPTFANDGNTGTRWSSAFSDPQWIEIDLQATYNISQVVLIWETASAKAYSIQVSNDNINWTTVQNVTNGVGGTETWNLTGASGRYIRMYGTLRNTIWGYSLYEFEVFGSALKGTNFFNGDTINTLKTVVYPNPFTNLITISTKTDVFKKAKIFDLEGKLLMEWEILPGETEITKDLSLFSNGIYLLKLEGPGTPETIKIIKQ
ncbi:MAG TPA: discoidin domain-containing protein, partial [Bacteroidales bacterium]